MALRSGSEDKFTPRHRRCHIIGSKIEKNVFSQQYIIIWLNFTANFDAPLVDAFSTHHQERKTNIFLHKSTFIFTLNNFILCMYVVQSIILYHFFDTFFNSEMQFLELWAFFKYFLFVLEFCQLCNIYVFLYIILCKNILNF